MMSNRMIQRSRPFANAVPEFSSTGARRRCSQGFDTNFRKHLPAKAAKEGEGAAGSAPPPPPDFGPGGGDECRKPEVGASGAGEIARPRVRSTAGGRRGVAVDAPILAALSMARRALRRPVGRINLGSGAA